MIRVLHSVSNMDRAGIETMLMNYYRHIDRSKVQFDFLCNKTKPGAYDEEIKQLGGRIFHSPGLNPIKFFKYKKYMTELFKTNPDIKIMHSHNGELAYQSLYGAYKNNIGVRICHAHNTQIEKNLKKPLKLLYKTQLKKVANNYWGCGTDAVRFYFGDEIVKQKKYFILHNAIDVDRFVYNEETRKKIRKELSIENKFVIGNVGRFMEQKNHAFILKVFNEILKINKDAYLLLLGDGELLEEIRKKSEEMNISQNIKFLGNVSNTNEIYQAMDVFLLPSLFEGLPVVGIEAQAAGLMCFFSDVITDEVKITDSVKYLKLEDGEKKWAEEILKHQTYNRKNMREEVIRAGYSIHEEAAKLQQIYLNFVENR